MRIYSVVISYSLQGFLSKEFPQMSTKPEKKLKLQDRRKSIVHPVKSVLEMMKLINTEYKGDAIVTELRCDQQDAKDPLHKLHKPGMHEWIERENHNRTDFMDGSVGFFPEENVSKSNQDLTCWCLQHKDDAKSEHIPTFCLLHS